MGDDELWPNLSELSVQGTRHPDILKLWLSLQHLGADGYAQIIRANYQLTEQFVQAVKARADLQLASEPQMNLVCFRLAPKGVPSEQWDVLNAQVQRELLREQQATFLSLPSYKGQRWFKAVLLNPYTCHSDIAQLFEQIDTFLLTVQSLEVQA